MFYGLKIRARNFCLSHTMCVHPPTCSLSLTMSTGVKTVPATTWEGHRNRLAVGIRWLVVGAAHLRHRAYRHVPRHPMARGDDSLA